MRRLHLLLLLAFLAPGVPSLAGCDSQQTPLCSSDAEFEIEDITPTGTSLGEAAVFGRSCVTVDYVGRLADGSGTFDQGTLNVLVANGQNAIPGFILGLSDQRVGQTRRVTIPPDLAYAGRTVPARPGTVGGVDGGEAYVGIPSCSVLEFDLTVTRINQDARLCTG